MKIKYLLAFAILFPVIIRAQEENIKMKFSGFADTYHAVRSQSPNDFMSSRSRLRTEFEAGKGKSYLFASLNSVYNSIDNSQTKIELREAFLQYTSNSWDLKAGRQIVTWGVADGLRITDIISPMDYSEFLARDYDDIRIPVNAFQLKYIKPSYNFELVFVPISEFFVFPVDEENPWSITQSFSMPYQIDMDKVPDNNIENSEYGGRFSFYLSGIDFSLSALHSWNKMPVFNYNYSQYMDTLLLGANYKRLDMLGLDFSLPVSKFVVRGEMAGYFDELIEYSNNIPIKKNSINFLLGIDWYPGNDWTITSQYYHKLIASYDDFMEIDENTSYTTLGITKKVLRSTLSLSSFSYVDIINQAFFNRISADYSLTDQIHLLVGYDWFHGDKGSFSYYKNNSEFWVKAKFSF
jgi:hypothetical protein